MNVVVTLSVDNSQVPYNSDPSLTYGGSTLFYNDDDTLKIPWAFIKAPRVIVHSENPFPLIYISSHDDYYTIFDSDLDDLFNFEFILPANTYDIVYSYDSGSEAPLFIIKENINIDGYVELNFNSSDANNKVILEGVDEQNRKLVDRENLYRSINIFFLIQIT